MHLEDYFNFLAPDDIRLKGSRIGIESILYEYIFREQTPPEIVQRFPTLSLEQVYATILYYLHYKEEVSAYLTNYLEWSHRAQKEQELNPSPAVIRLRELRKQQLAERQAARVPQE
jgi:uncharacterized protein (DUF433 family)